MATAGNDIKRFIQLMSDPASKQVFEQAKARREEDANGANGESGPIEGWQVVEHGDWLESKGEEGFQDAANGRSHETGVAKIGQEPKSEEEIKKILDSFQANKGKGWGCRVEEAGKRIMVCPSRLKCSFVVLNAALLQEKKSRRR